MKVALLLIVCFSATLVSHAQFSSTTSSRHSGVAELFASANVRDAFKPPQNPPVLRSPERFAFRVL